MSEWLKKNKKKNTTPTYTAYMRLQIESHTETGNINKGERYVNGNDNKKGEAGIALFTLAKSLKQPRCSSLDERIEVGVCVHTTHWGVTQP